MLVLSGVGKAQTKQSLMDQEVVVAGSPETVRKKLIEYQRVTNMGNLMCLMQFGTLPADLTKRSMELFAREVMPALRPLGDHTAEPVRTAAE